MHSPLNKMHSSTHLTHIQMGMDHFLIHLDSTYPVAVVARVIATVVVGVVVVVDLGVGAAVVPVVDKVLKLNAPTLSGAIPKPK